MQGNRMEWQKLMHKHTTHLIESVLLYLANLSKKCPSFQLILSFMPFCYDYGGDTFHNSPLNCYVLWCKHKTIVKHFTTLYILIQSEPFQKHSYINIRLFFTRDSALVRVKNIYFWSHLTTSLPRLLENSTCFSYGFL